jgi:hypothetical protein
LHLKLQVRCRVPVGLGDLKAIALADAAVVAFVVSKLHGFSVYSPMQG